MIDIDCPYCGKSIDILFRKEINRLIVHGKSDCECYHCKKHFEIYNGKDKIETRRYETMSRDLKLYDMVIHFKHEEDLESNKTKYVYMIEAFAKHTETGEMLVIYKNLKSNESFARPYDMFMSEVDHEKYPHIKQKYRLEKWNPKHERLEGI